MHNIQLDTSGAIANLDCSTGTRVAYADGDEDEPGSTSSEQEQPKDTDPPRRQVNTTSAPPDEFGDRSRGTRTPAKGGDGDEEE